MQELLDSFLLLFKFLFGQMTEFASFLTTNTLGIIIIGIPIFGILISFVISIINKLHR